MDNYKVIIEFTQNGLNTTQCSTEVLKKDHSGEEHPLDFACPEDHAAAYMMTGIVGALAVYLAEFNVDRDHVLSLIYEQVKQGVALLRGDFEKNRN